MRGFHSSSLLLVLPELHCPTHHFTSSTQQLLLFLTGRFSRLSNQQFVLPMQIKAATGGQGSAQECAFAASLSMVLGVKVGPGCS